MPTQYSDAPEQRFLSRKDAAELLGCSVRTVDRYCNDKLLDARRIGPKMVRVTMASIEALLAKQAS